MERTLFMFLFGLLGMVEVCVCSVTVVGCLL